MKKIILSAALAVITCIAATIVNPTQAAWSHDGYGYTSNVCRNGYYWQFVSWNYVGTDCYMPGWGLYGRRVAE